MLMVLQIISEEVRCSVGNIGRPGREFQQEPALLAPLDWPKQQTASKQLTSESYTVPLTTESSFH